MIWLIYIPGWFFGWAVFNGLTAGLRQSKIDEMLGRTDWFTLTRVVIWTLLWIGICLRYIK